LDESVPAAFVFEFVSGDELQAVGVAGLGLHDVFTSASPVRGL